MAFEQRDNSGILFKNDYKKKESQPDWKGDAMIDGVKKSIAVWEKIGKKGPFLSVKIEDAKDTTKPQQGYKSTSQQIDDDVPF